MGSSSRLFLWGGALLLGVFLLACAADPPEPAVIAITTVAPGSPDTPTTSTLSMPTTSNLSMPTTSTPTTSTAASTTTIAVPAAVTTTPSPAPVAMGVVLVDPLIDDVLNLREWPGTSGPILAGLHRTQTQLIPTGRTAPVDGRPWYELVAGDITGWSHGRYLTETWTNTQVDQSWDWKTAIDRFAAGLAGRRPLTEAVTWRGFYAVDHGGALHWWRPEQVRDLLNDTTAVAWNFQGATAEEIGVSYTFSELIAEPFLDDYHDTDTTFTVGDRPLGAGSVIPSAAVSTAFQNFVSVAMHDPGDNPQWDGLDWTTWFIYLELDGPTPKVVGVQLQTWGP